MEMARCLMHEKDLPKRFWAEAANTAVFLLNRLPTKAVEGKTPYEAWYGVKPVVKNLRVFGCLCYSHVPQTKRSKLDEKSEPGIFVGYSLQSKGYRVFQPQTDRVIVSRDVVFLEEEKWSWNNENQVKSSVSSPQQPEVPVSANDWIDEMIDDEPKWIEAMKEEMMMIEKNGTWQLTDRPPDRKVIGVKWVYRTKLNPDGSVNKLKARLVVKGYAQVWGIDYSETFAPVARLDTIRLLLAIAAQKSWKIFQLDVKSAFLNGVLEEEIYVEQPEGFAVKGVGDK
ncbi:hypothetical protein CRG98_043380, partial [Punica granatum]